MKSLEVFYTDPANLQKLTDVLVRGGCVSLRTLDYLVTNYAKSHGVCYVLSDPITGEERLFNMHMDYKNALRSFSKKMFDVFKRRSRVTFHDTDGAPFESTPAQLNFFRWAIKHKVLEYGIAHATYIEKDMARTSKVEANPAAEAPVGKVRRHTVQSNGTRTTLVRVKVRFA